MAKAHSFLRRELLEFIPPAIFFFIAFHILATTRALMLEEQGIKVTTTAGITVAALVVAKALLIADLFPFIDKFPRKPLIYNILWKTFIYLLASFVIRFIEHLIEMWPKGAGLSKAVRHVFDAASWQHFLAVQIWLLVLLLVYTSGQELTRAVGRERMVDIVFRKGVS